jgi:hypothetical protein
MNNHKIASSPNEHEHEHDFQCENAEYSLPHVASHSYKNQE